MKQYNQSEKIKISVGAVVLLTIAYGFSGFKKSKFSDVNPSVNQINYEMGHVKSKSDVYSLNGREIDYQSEGHSLDQQTVKDSQNVSLNDQKQKQKNEEAKKQLDPSVNTKKVSSLPKNNNKQRRAAQTNNQISQKKKQVEGGQSKLDHGYSSAPYVENKSTNVETSQPNKKSYDQWRSEIFASQNKETIQSLFVAYKKNELSSENFYNLVNEMLNSKDDKMIGLGIYALRATPSYLSYSTLVKLEGHVNSSYDSYIKETLMSYHKNGLGILKQALSSSDQVIVTRTLEVVKSGLTYIKAGTVANLGDIRDTRGSIDIQYSVSNYNSFLPFLKNLTDDQYSAEISDLAMQVIALIGDGSYIASNP